MFYNYSFRVKEKAMSTFVKFYFCLSKNTQKNYLFKGSGNEWSLKEVRIKPIQNHYCNKQEVRDCTIRPCMICASGLHKAPCDGDSGNLN